MWEPYLKVIRERCSDALHILDRFHIVAKMNKALDEIRAEGTRRMKHEGRDLVLKKSRWLLLKGASTRPYPTCGTRQASHSRPTGAVEFEAVDLTPMI
jgi:transposase